MLKNSNAQLKVFDNCLVCSIGMIFKFSAICGIFPISCTCDHTKTVPNSSTATFRPSIIGLVYSMIITIILCSVIIWYIILMVQNFGKDEMELMELLAEALYYTSALAISTTSVLKFKQRVSNFTGLTKIIDNRKQYGFHSLISSKATKRIRKLCLIYGIGMGLIVTTVSSIALTRSYDKIANWSTVRRPMSTMVGFIQVIIVILFSVELVVFTTIIKTSNRFLKIYMTKYMHYIENRKRLPYGLSVLILYDKSLLYHLQGAQRLYISIFQSIQLFTHVLRPAFLFWVWLILGCVIFNSYVFITAWLTGLEDTRFVTLLELRTLAISVILSHLLWNIERFSNVSEDILSFLFKYPISKLNTAEAAQVEMLITTLKIQKPVLRASDIFTVGTRLLASISGTVVTYVLVALQFHASWAK